MKSTGELICLRRVKAGLKVGELAAKAKVSRNTIGNYEAGRTKPPTDVLTRIAEVLCCQPSDLVDDIPPAMVRYRLTGRDAPWSGYEFDVEEGASEEEVCRAAWDAVAEHVSFGWERVDPKEVSGG